MESININAAPVEVQQAFEHVRSFFPEVTSVAYDEDCRWCFMTDDLNAPSFCGVDVEDSILEAAADAQYNIAVPVTYTL